MRKLRIVAAALLATGVGLGFSASSAQAVTWSNQAIRTSTTYIDNCDGTTGSMVVKVRFQLSNESPQRARLDKDVDLSIENKSKHGIEFWTGTNPAANGGIMWERFYQNEVVSHYIGIRVAGVYSFTIAPGHTSTLSVDNSDRWERDNINSQVSAPYALPLSVNGYPGLELSGYTAGACHQKVLDEIGYLG